MHSNTSLCVSKVFCEYSKRLFKFDSIEYSWLVSILWHLYWFWHFDITKIWFRSSVNLAVTSFFLAHRNRNNSRKSYRLWYGWQENDYSETGSHKCSFMRYFWSCRTNNASSIHWILNNHYFALAILPWCKVRHIKPVQSFQWVGPSGVRTCVCWVSAWT